MCTALAKDTLSQPGDVSGFNQQCSHNNAWYFRLSFSQQGVNRKVEKRKLSWCEVPI